MDCFVAALLAMTNVGAFWRLVTRKFVDQALTIRV
jgi:hypothetical protein